MPKYTNSMREKPFVAPEEGDLNTAKIKKGLSPDEKAYLKRDLEAVESGRGSSDTPALGSNPSQEFFAQRSYEDDKQREREIYENNFSSFVKFVREKGISEEDMSYDELDYYFQNSESENLLSGYDNEDVELIKRVMELDKEWESKK